MKTHLIVACFLLLNVAAGAQQKDISVFEKKDGDKNIVVARNIGKVPYLVKLDIHATGMNVEPGLKTETVVPPGFMKDLATLTPLPGEAWTYGYDVSYVQYTGEDASPSATEPASVSPIPEVKTNTPPAPTTSTKTEVDKNEIVIYSKPGCSRCAFVKKNLTEKGIKYREVDVTSGVPEVNDMWMNLRHGGFSGESVTMPVVKLKGQLHYNIKDLQAFVNSVEK
jgi:glutaredoxin